MDKRAEKVLAGEEDSGSEGSSDENEGSEDENDGKGDEDDTDAIQFLKLHGNMTQQDRSSVFNTFRSAKSGVLLCTVSVRF